MAQWFLQCSELPLNCRGTASTTNVFCVAVCFVHPFWKTQLSPLSVEYQCLNQEEDFRAATLKSSVLPDVLFCYSHVHLPIWQDAAAELSAAASCIKLNTCYRVFTWRNMYFKNTYSEQVSPLWTTEILHFISLSVVVTALRHFPPSRISQAMAFC